MMIALPAALAACRAIVGIDDRYLAPNTEEGGLDSGGVSDPADGSGAAADPDGGTQVEAALASDGDGDGDGTDADADANADANDADAADATDAAEATAPADACPAPGTATDFYVDHAGGNCAYTTIGAAVVAAESSTATTKTIHVAPGTYDAPSEVFPLSLRDGISLAGAGSTETFLVGAGPVPRGGPENAFGALSTIGEVSPSVTDLSYVTLLVGDPSLPSTVSGLSIKPPSSFFAGTEAIVCDQGNAGPSTAAPNTVIHDVLIDGFEIGVRVTWSNPSRLSGCNALLTASTIQNGSFGVVADGLPRTGAGADAGADAAAPQLVSVQLGDGTPSGGNTLRNLHVADPNSPMYFDGAGLATADAVSGVVVRGNHFFQDPPGDAGASPPRGDIGIWASQSSGPRDPRGFDIEDNDFGPLMNIGVLLTGPVVVSQLIGNSFHDISMSDPTLGFPALGLAILSQPTPLPAISRARDNSFIGNDVGAFLTLNSDQAPGMVQVDFGTTSDPGGNGFRCNSAAAGSPGLPGGDVIVQVLQAPAAVPVPLAGNVWDHAPPTMGSGASQADAPSGLDLFVYPQAEIDASVPALFDVSGAISASTPACPSGRVPGP